MDVRALLKELSEASGVSGYEDAIRSSFAAAVEPLVDELRADSLGNLIALKRGRSTSTCRRSIMLAAHSDEIGLMVTGFERGFLRFTTVGGVDLRTIVGQEVTVHGQRDLAGIVATRPPHVLPPDQCKKAIPIENLFIDVGLPADRLEATVQVGDLVTMRRDFIKLAGDFVSGKAFDDRTGVVSLVVCLDALRQLDHSWDVYAVATSQEEVGLRGATVSAYGIAPDVAIAIDVTFGMQQGVSETEAVKMDGGPALGMGPNVHPAMLKRLQETAETYELKHQLEIVPGRSGTDAWAIQVTRDGVPTGLVSIPLRYMHTSVETVSIKDIERTGRLLAWFIAGLDEDFAAGLCQVGGNER